MTTRRSATTAAAEVERQLKALKAAAIKPVEKNKTVLDRLAKAFGGVSALCTAIHTFMTYRERATSWRVVSDAASRDRATYGRNESDRRELTVPFPPLTVYLADQSGEANDWDREAILTALATLADEPEAKAAGLSIKHAANVNVDTPYATVSIARRSGGRLADEQRAYFED